MEDRFYSNLPENYQYFPANCQHLLISNLCADIYHKCDSAVSANYGYSDGLPYERPCLQNCMDLISYCPTITRMMGVNIGCDMNMTEWDGNGTAPEHLPYRYDHSNNISQCNAMSTPPVFQTATVSYNDYISNSTVEELSDNELTFNFDSSVDICLGYVSDYSVPYTEILNVLYNDTELDKLVGDIGTLPASNLTNANIQTYLNTIVYKYITYYLPRYSRSGCYDAMRSYVCNSIFISNINITSSYLKEIILAGNSSENVTMPVYMLDRYGYSMTLGAFSAEGMIPVGPDASLSANVFSECDSLFSNERFQTNVPNMSTISSFVDLSSNEVDIAFTIDNSTEYSFVFDLATNTGSNTISSMVAPFMPSCPRQFAPVTVSKRHPTDGIEFVNGGGCGQSCKSPYWTEAEWELFLNLKRCSMYIPFLPLCLIIYTWTKHKQKKKQYLAITFMSISLVFISVVGITSLIPWKEHFCYDEVTLISLEFDKFNSCVVEGIIVVYCWIALTIAWLLQIIAAMRQVLFRWKPVKYEGFYANLSLIFGLPLLPVLYGIINNKFGYTSGYIICTYHDPQNIEYTNMITIGLPIFGMLAIGGICMTSIIVHMLKTVVVKKTTKILWQPVFFFVSFFGMWLGFLIFRVTFDIQASKQSWRLWQSDIFDAFEASNGDSDAAYAAVGQHPNHRPFSLVLLNMALTGTQGFVISGIYIVDVYRMWVPYLYRKLTGKLWIVNTAQYEETGTDTGTRSSVGDSGISTYTAETLMSNSRMVGSSVPANRGESSVAVRDTRSASFSTNPSVVVPVRKLPDNDSENRSSTVSKNKRNSAAVVPFDGNEELSGPLLKIPEVNSDAFDSTCGVKASSNKGSIAKSEIDPPLIEIESQIRENFGVHKDPPLSPGSDTGALSIGGGTNSMNKYINV